MFSHPQNQPTPMDTAQSNVNYPIITPENAPSDSLEYTENGISVSLLTYTLF